MIPLGPSAVRTIRDRLLQYPFDRLYGAFGRHVLMDAQGVIERSAEKYLRQIAEG